MHEIQSRIDQLTCGHLHAEAPLIPCQLCCWVPPQFFMLIEFGHMI
jgi:hypothetical protein